jgi:hypothetical protein
MNSTVFAVRELCRSRELAYIVIGHKWLLSPDAIRAFIRKREEKFRSGSVVDQERLRPPGPERSKRNLKQLVQGSQSMAWSLRMQSQQFPTGTMGRSQIDKFGQVASIQLAFCPTVPTAPANGRS